MRFLTKAIIVLMIGSFYSCEKVIDLELKDSDLKYVVEGVITNEPGVCKVIISQSRPFYEDNQFAAVSGATVKVKDNGQEVPLTETRPGVYETKAINGTPGHEYHLSVVVDNQAFTASCIMPRPVPLDTLYVEPGPFNQFKFAKAGFNDPAGEKNHYRFVQYLNGKKDPTIFWESDEFTNGMSMLIMLDTAVDKQDDPRNIVSGDEVTVEMLCLDEAIYKYWYSLRTGGGDGSVNSAAPANPVTNIKGGALGYFSAHTVDRRTVIAP